MYINLKLSTERQSDGSPSELELVLEGLEWQQKVHRAQLDDKIREITVSAMGPAGILQGLIDQLDLGPILKDQG